MVLMLVRMLTVHCAVQAAPLQGPLQWWPARAQHRLLSFSPCHLKFSVLVTITTIHNFNLNFKTLTKPSFRIWTKIKLHNLNQASAEKYWPNFSFKIVPELQL